MNQPIFSEIEQHALQLKPEEQLALMERLAHNLQGGRLKKAPRRMYGAWKGYFPEDLDVDQALKEIRNAWKKDLDDA